MSHQRMHGQSADKLEVEMIETLVGKISKEEMQSDLLSFLLHCRFPLPFKVKELRLEVITYKSSMLKPDKQRKLN